MIRSLRALGRHIRHALGNDPAEIVEQLALTSAEEDGDEERSSRLSRQAYIGVLDICPRQGVLRHRLEEVSAQTLRRYLWIQLMKFSPGGDVRDVTVLDLKYLLGPVFAGLAPKALGLTDSQDAALDELVTTLAPALARVRDFGGRGRDRFLLDLGGLRVEPPPSRPDVHGEYVVLRDGTIDISWDKLGDVEPKKRAELVAKDLRDILGWKRDVKFFTLSVEGRSLAQESAYRRFVLTVLVEEPFAEGVPGICHLCGARTHVTTNFTRMRIKVYINDKRNFAGNLTDEGFLDRYSACRDCYLDLLLADRLLEQELQSQLLQTAVFLIPEFVSEPRGGLEEVRRRLQRIRQESTELARLQHLRRAPEDIARAARERAGLYAALTLLFHEKQNMAVKVREVIAEVPPSRIQEVIRAINAVNTAGEDGGWAEPLVAQSRSGWFEGLDALLQTLPLRRSQGKPVVRPALTLARQLLQQEPIDLAALHADFLEGARAIVSRHLGYWVVPREWEQRTPGPDQVDRAMRRFIARTLALRLIAKEVGCVERGGASVDSVIPEVYRSAMTGLELNEQEQSLFLLGILVARVASEQYRSDQSGTKPILEKLNYTGMSLPRVTVFATELFDKLRQYRLLSGPGAAENELLYAEAVQRLTRHRGRWLLTDAENVYFILAGYSYETGRIIRSGKGKERDQEAEEQTVG
ncbi:MAG: TM1802 family CRISPR-associated protein [Thermomicrobium sp.]|nr:TM1802 family CRISPR-associated protein [Thermomicrobium sp.]